MNFKNGVISGMLLALSACQSTNNESTLGRLPSSIEDEKLGKCSGINSCRGMSDCASNGHSCAGKNSCKGQGWLTLTRNDCQTEGGSFSP